MSEQVAAISGHDVHDASIRRRFSPGVSSSQRTPPQPGQLYGTWSPMLLTCDTSLNIRSAITASVLISGGTALLLPCGWCTSLVSNGPISAMGTQKSTSTLFSAFIGMPEYAASLGSCTIATPPHL